jgi:hypothetical protein
MPKLRACLGGKPEAKGVLAGEPAIQKEADTP